MDLKTRNVTELSINTIRTLAMDAVQKANSGHPGTPMALAPVAYTIFTKFLQHNPENPSWPDRDRFVLSAGHASMLLYSLLHLTGYDLTMDDLKTFRQWGSRTPGHPEHSLTPGVETTTGPLGQGFFDKVRRRVMSCSAPHACSQRHHHARREGARRSLPAAVTAPNRSRKACAFLRCTTSRRAPRMPQARPAPAQGLG